MGDLTDQGSAVEGAQVLDGLRVLHPRNGAVGLLQRILGKLAAARPPLGQPANRRISCYSREILMEPHGSSSGRLSGQWQRAGAGFMPSAPMGDDPLQGDG